ncbi:peritrophin-48-like [Anastrepha ludens]|uniref:peritrophin-48-like n=1 Tax=Anastrepha ludens TaxID=28586 RepID=UPI0023AF6B3B|nr:peritrophin-48-like [Anastrepha ludens]
MKVLALPLTLAIPLALLWAGFIDSSLSADSDDICWFFPNATKIRDPLSCGQYITCIDSVAHYTACTSSTPYFDKETGKCVKTLTNYTGCEISCEENEDLFINDPSSCSGYYFCKTATTPIHGYCPSGTHFNSTTQSCIFRVDSTCELKELDICLITPNGVKIASDTNCGRYHECKKKVLSSKDCSTGQYYNPPTGTCLSKWKVACAKHPVPDNVCGTTKRPYINKFVSDGATCRGYYYCAERNVMPDPAPVWGSCPNGTFFNPTTQACANPSSTACPSGADRCEGRSLTFVSSSDKGCRQYLRCKDGKTQEELSCGNKFFNEALGACVSSPITYAFCAS